MLTDQVKMKKKDNDKIKKSVQTSSACGYKRQNTTIAEFAHIVDPDETAHNEPSHLDLQCLSYSL